MSRQSRKSRAAFASPAQHGAIGVGMFRVGPLMATPALLTELGVDPGELLAEFGLETANFQDPEHTLPFALVSRIFGRCVECTGCEHFALLVGQRAGAPSLGAIGYLMLSSATVGSALGVLTEHLNVQDRGAVAAVRIDSDRVSLSYSIVEPGVEHVDQVYGISMAVARNIMRGLCGSDWCPDAVEFAFAKPRDVEPYRRFFHVTPRFDVGETALIFPARTLDQPLPSADVLLNKLMQQRVEELAFRSIGDVEERVRRLLRLMITSPDCSLTTVAQRIDTHERTLKRQLAAANTSFRAIREEVRFEAACQFLANTRVAVGEVAFIVGYSDPSAFTRAFQRWSGSAPNQWRAAMKRRPLGRR
jgi:AraC-like DNA-binding protein